LASIPHKIKLSVQPRLQIALFQGSNEQLSFNSKTLQPSIQPTMKLVWILSLINLARCAQSSAEQITAIGLENQGHRNLQEHMNEDDHGFDIRGFKASKKGVRPDVPINIVKGHAYSELEDYENGGKGGGKGTKKGSSQDRSRGSKKTKKSKCKYQKIDVAMMPGIGSHYIHCSPKEKNHQETQAFKARGR
jgi:hypothetical protein